MIGTAAGYPQRSGIVIPEIWAAKANIKLYDDTFLSDITCSDYEEEIKKEGDVVHIKNVGDVTLRRYYKGTDMVIQNIEDTLIDLVVDQSWYYDFGCDDIDSFQAKGGSNSLMNDWADDAGHKAAETFEDIVINDVDADAHADNVGATAGRISSSYNLGVSGTPKSLTKADVVDILVDARSTLRENKCPRNDLWSIIPEWFAGMIMKSDLQDASLTGDGKSIIRDQNGRLGIIAGLTLYESNILEAVTDGSDTCYSVLCGWKKAIAFAAQMTKVRKVEPFTTWSTLMQGLYVFGYKVLRPQGLAVIYCKKGSE